MVEVHAIFRLGLNCKKKDLPKRKRKKVEKIINASAKLMGKQVKNKVKVINLNQLKYSKWLQQQN